MINNRVVSATFFCDHFIFRGPFSKSVSNHTFGEWCIRYRNKSLAITSFPTILLCMPFATPKVVTNVETSDFVVWVLLLNKAMRCRTYCSQSLVIVQRIELNFISHRFISNLIVSQSLFVFVEQVYDFQIFLRLVEYRVIEFVKLCP